jgi:hypothetical protein
VSRAASVVNGRREINGRNGGCATCGEVHLKGSRAVGGQIKVTLVTEFHIKLVLNDSGQFNAGVFSVVIRQGREVNGSLGLPELVHINGHKVF